MFSTCLDRERDVIPCRSSCAPPTRFHQTDREPAWNSWASSTTTLITSTSNLSVGHHRPSTFNLSVGHHRPSGIVGHHSFTFCAVLVIIGLLCIWCLEQVVGRPLTSPTRPSGRNTKIASWVIIGLCCTNGFSLFMDFTHGHLF